MPDAQLLQSYLKRAYCFLPTVMDLLPSFASSLSITAVSFSTVVFALQTSFISSHRESSCCD